jgi:hypothetical protein
MDTEKVDQGKTEAEAQVFIAENEPLLERATPATLHRIILHGEEIAGRLSGEVVAEMNEEMRVLNEAADAINDDATPPARIQELEEERMRVQAQESTKRETFGQLDHVIQRATTLRREREAPAELAKVTVKPTKTVVKQEPRHPFWQRLFGGR